MSADPRLTLARADLAAQSLEGVIAAERYQPTTLHAIAAPAAPLHREPDPASERMDELIHGELFEALEPRGDYVWGQARRDGYVGFVRAADLAPAGPPPTHRVGAIRTYAFAEPSIKTAALGPYSLNALVCVDREDGKFSHSAAGGWFWTAHLAPIGAFERDPAAVAERFLGAPYLWGGRTSVGLDCSGLIQQALYACGRASPRDTDLQLAAGAGIARADLARGDLVGWRGHIGMMLDANRLIHANAHHMAVAIEPVDEAITRIEAGGYGPTVFRRV
jgi:cell wall-associated NlpC family hydrolase